MTTDNNIKKNSHPVTAKEQTINFGDFEPQEDAKQAAPQHTRASEGRMSGFSFISFGSGSSGNSAYVGNENGGVIIDAGIEDDIVFDTLARNGVSPSRIKGIILTHDHQDHVRYVYKLVRRFKHIRIYCTPRLLGGLLRRHNISRRVKEYQDNIFIEIPFHVAGMTITAFQTSHDGTDNMGFDIELDGQHFVFAPDMGMITERAHYYMSRANYLSIESNYDLKMLLNGTYPEYLKCRVRGARGHLDNTVAAQFVADNYHEGLRYVFLNHLSKDNNTPAKACETMATALEGIGLSVGDGSNAVGQRECDIQVYALPRFVPSLWFVL